MKFRIFKYLRTNKINMRKKLELLFACTAVLYGCGTNPKEGSSEIKIKDSIVVSSNLSEQEDASAKIQTIKEVEIGEQIWMSENLNVSKFRNGDFIPEAKTEEEWMAAGNEKRPAWCYYRNDTLKGAKFGKLYNWYAVSDPRGLAPEGWHIPDKKEWNDLISFLTKAYFPEETQYSMKTAESWSSFTKGKNLSGFSALPGLSRNSVGVFNEDVAEFTIWWSSSTGIGDNYAW